MYMGLLKLNSFFLRLLMCESNTDEYAGATYLFTVFPYMAFACS